MIIGRLFGGYKKGKKNPQKLTFKGNARIFM